MGLLEGLASVSVGRSGAGEMAAWKPEDSSGVLLSRPLRGLRSRPRDSLSGAGGARGSNPPPSNECRKSSISTLSLARCVGTHNPRLSLHGR